MRAKIYYINTKNNTDAKNCFNKMFAEKLKNELSISNLDAGILAYKTGISYNTINGYLNGLISPSAYYVSLIADVLNCSIDRLIPVVLNF